MGASINQINLSPDLFSHQNRESPHDLPSASQLLTTGGHSPLLSTADQGQNKSGRPPFPVSDVFAYGSSTASTITSGGFAAVERLRLRLLRATRADDAASVYARELTRIRTELGDLCELSSPVDIIFA